MTLTVFLAVLCAAAMHAIWNAIIKVRLDRFASISLMTLGMGAAALPVLPFVDLPQGKVWFWIVLSAAIHIGYRLFLINAYETGDLAQTYPLARGTAPLLTTIGGVLLLGEIPAGLSVVGILLLSTGTLLMSLRGGAQLGALDRRSVGFALVTSVCVAGYTLTDGSGARLAATASSYAAWLFVVDGLWTLALCLYIRGRGILAAMLPEWKTGILTGLLGCGILLDRHVGDDQGADRLGGGVARNLHPVCHVHRHLRLARKGDAMAGRGRAPHRGRRHCAASGLNGLPEAFAKPPAASSA